MVSENLCPVCGCKMQDPPRDYNICPSCGTEFGLHDVNASTSDLRSAWLRTGPKWWSTVTPEPENWNPVEQLANLPDAQTSGAESLPLEPSPAGTVMVPVAVMYPQQPIRLDPKVTFRFAWSGNAVFTETENFRDLVFPAVLELKEATAR